jgi:hypothetical protein
MTELEKSCTSKPTHTAQIKQDTTTGRNRTLPNGDGSHAGLIPVSPQISEIQINKRRQIPVQLQEIGGRERVARGRRGRDLLVCSYRRRGGNRDRRSRGRAGSLQSRLRGHRSALRHWRGGRRKKRDDRRSGVVHACADLVGPGSITWGLGKQVKKGTGNEACTAH